jgi:hypothetical protein
VAACPADQGDELCDATEEWEPLTCDMSVWQTTLRLEQQERAPPEPPPVSGTAGERTCLSHEQESSVARIAATIGAFFPERCGDEKIEDMKAVALRAFK